MKRNILSVVILFMNFSLTSIMNFSLTKISLIKLNRKTLHWTLILKIVCRKLQVYLLGGFALAISLSGCGGGGGADSDKEAPPQQVCNIDCELSKLIEPLNLTGDPTLNRVLPNINDPIPQLGKKLFFSKSLSGNMDTACASCHHPALGGGDSLSLAVGTGAETPELLGVGRRHANDMLVPRNAPTTFNVGLYDSGLFWDSRIESLGKEANQNGGMSAISTPDSGVTNGDPDAGPNLVAAQARFPVISPLEMRGDQFDADTPNDQIRAHIASRIGGYGSGAAELSSNDWLTQFQLAFNSNESAESLVTFDNIMLAISEYLRSQVFIESPWKRYLEGDLNALTLAQKRGALLFFNEEMGSGGVAVGATCSSCHKGDFFTDELHHKVGFPQIGPGKSAPNSDDFGRESISGFANERYRFRTPSLLNTEVSGPWGHSGSYASLEEVIQHYADIQTTVEDYFNRDGWCELAQFRQMSNCSSLFPDAKSNTQAALDLIEQDRNNFVSIRASGVIPRLNLSDQEIQDLVAFMSALTDPCVKDPACLAPWVADPNSDGPDGNQLNGVDSQGNPIF